MPTTFIYALSDPNTGEVRYIGKSNDIQMRLKQHVYAANRHRKSHLHHWVNTVVKNGWEPTISIIEEVPKENWQEREIFWIDHYKNKLGARLTNATPGGDAPEISPETRETIRQANLGSKRGEGTKQRIRETWESEDRRARQSARMKENMKKRWASKESREQQSERMKKAWSSGERDRERQSQIMSSNMKKRWEQEDKKIFS